MYMHSVYVSVAMTLIATCVECRFNNVCMWTVLNASHKSILPPAMEASAHGDNVN